ncbi:DUF1467 family protein [Denitrobaculum tricleocarpae]|uniref:DUF1467 family protein n=1 Tax=Denitrobaculum tricleocarpae TaxID=2591009 RepID=A0A545TPH1_9PROT|nr:DUF1467 family protein [Denitrobaculum tricleocarpae]TQV79113.1 DUF1467 family protein [Denitrobaculum tricleocarpae]
MNWFTGILVYIIVWWVMLFAVLPWGVRKVENPEEGHEVGAPANPMLGRKALITTGLAAVVWVAIYFALENKVIPLRVE